MSVFSKHPDRTALHIHGCVPAPVRALPCLWILVVVLVADSASGEGLRDRIRCKNNFDSVADLAFSDASLDAYHGLAYFGAGAAVSLAGGPNRRWSSRNDFDTGIRDDLRLGSLGSRRAADRASDVLLAFSMAILPASGLLSKHLSTQDCVESWDMATDALESLGLTLFLTNVIKEVAGRERPYGRSCDTFALRDSDCSTDDRQQSFVSGHSSIAAAGAGLSCAFAFEREAWGSSIGAKWGPCMLGAAAAVATGMLRVGADRHWTSDVLAGFAMGAVIGYFDTWGPLDLLKFDLRNEKGQIAARGMVLPHAHQGTLGAQLVMTF